MQDFLYGVLHAALLHLQFRSVLFWRKNIGAKAVHKVLAKLTLYGYRSLLFSECVMFVWTNWDSRITATKTFCEEFQKVPSWTWDSFPMSCITSNITWTSSEKCSD